jgi:hypothetical protein
MLSTLYRVPLGILVFVSMAVQFSHSNGAANWDPVNFISFFTIQSNVLAASLFLSCATVWRRRSSPTIDSWRGAAVVYMVVTGLVYAVLLSGLDDQLQTTLPWVNTVLHRVMPVAVALDWLIVPPVSRLGLARALRWLIFPAVWLGYTLVRGAIVDWYPYPFVDAGVKGYLSVALACAGIAVLFAALIWVVQRVGDARVR